MMGRWTDISSAILLIVLASACLGQPKLVPSGVSNVDIGTVAKSDRVAQRYAIVISCHDYGSAELLQMSRAALNGARDLA